MKLLQALPLDLKIAKTQNRIREWYNYYGGEVYVSFSGGKDSTVLHHLIDEAIPDNKIPRVFINTGIEYNEIRMFVEKLTGNDCRFVIFNSGVNIKEMLNEKGYPFKSKEHSCNVPLFLSGFRTNQRIRT